MTDDGRFRAMVPTEIVLPCEHTSTVVSVPLTIEDDPIRVIAPFLYGTKGALAVGSSELVRSYCELWTRWLRTAIAAQHAPERREEP